MTDTKESTEESTDLQALISIKSVPAKVDANFEELKRALGERLETYDFIVSADGITDAKKAATEINKLKNTLAQRRKEVAAELKVPLEYFDRQMKELEADCEAVRQGILNQVKQYEEKLRAQCEEQLVALRKKYWDELDVPAAFRRCGISDLVNVSSLTAKGNLGKKARDAVVLRTNEDKRLSDLVELRLAKLEARSYEAGLAAPLTFDHIAGFIETDEETFERELQRMLDMEVERERVAERRRQERAQREQEERERREREEQARRERKEQLRRESERAEQQTDASQPAPEQAPAEERAPAAPETVDADMVPMTEDEAGMVRLTVVAEFEIQIDSRVPDDAIIAEARRKFSEIGVTTLTDVRVVR